MSDFSPLRKPHFPHMWWAFDSYEPRNGWSREALLNGRSVCSVICEESIRSKLRNSRIGGAITADIRPLNHPTFQPLSYLWESFLAAHISPCLPSSVLVFENLPDWKSSVHQLLFWELLPKLLINQALISQHLNSPLKLCTLTRLAQFWINC